MAQRNRTIIDGQGAPEHLGLEGVLILEALGARPDVVLEPGEPRDVLTVPQETQQSPCRTLLVSPVTPHVTGTTR